VETCRLLSRSCGIASRSAFRCEVREEETIGECDTTYGGRMRHNSALHRDGREAPHFGQQSRAPARERER
jgi:hypothetical protein